MHISKQLKVKNKLAAKSFFRTSEMKLIKFLNIFTTWNPIGTTLFVHGNPKNRDQEAEEKRKEKRTGNFSFKGLENTSIFLYLNR